MSNQPPGLNGISPLAYVGVNPRTPMNLRSFTRAPTTHDTNQFLIGDHWLWSSEERLWVLVAKSGGIATWKEFTLDGMSSADEFVTDAGTAIPLLGVIDIIGGANINTAGATNVVTVNLDTSITQPATSADGVRGLYSLGASDFMHGYGFDNTFLGSNAGNRTLTVVDATSNTGIGALALTTLTTGSNNTAVGVQSSSVLDTGSNNTSVGFLSLNALTTGQRNVSLGASSSTLLTTANDNTAVGHAALQRATAGTNVAIGSDALTNLTTGDSNTGIGTVVLNGLLTGTNNIAIGDLSGLSYIGAESSNILINNNGVVTENNTIRIGTQGAGAGQQNAAYMAGVYGSAVGGTNAFVVVDNTGKLGTTGVTPGATIPFFGYSAATAADVSGAGVLYQLGSASALTTLYDFSGGFFPGDGLGTPASFTAPVTGYYSLSMTVSTSWPDGTNASSSFYYISSGANTWYLSQQSGTPASPPGSPPYLDTASGSALINMTIGDVAVFNVVIGSVGLGMQNISVTGAAAPLYVTYVSGSRVA